MNYENFNPRAFLLAQARELLTQAANAAMADGSLPQAELPAFITEIPADRKTAMWPATWPWPVPVHGTRPPK